MDSPKKPEPERPHETKPRGTAALITSGAKYGRRACLVAQVAVHSWLRPRKGSFHQIGLSAIISRSIQQADRLLADPEEHWHLALREGPAGCQAVVTRMTRLSLSMKIFATSELSRLRHPLS